MVIWKSESSGRSFCMRLMTSANAPASGSVCFPAIAHDRLRDMRVLVAPNRSVSRHYLTGTGCHASKVGVVLCVARFRSLEMAVQMTVHSILTCVTKLAPPPKQPASAELTTQAVQKIRASCLTHRHAAQSRRLCRPFQPHKLGRGQQPTAPARCPCGSFAHWLQDPWQPTPQ